jgi:hypothetical protein
MLPFAALARLLAGGTFYALPLLAFPAAWQFARHPARKNLTWWRWP